MFKSCSVPHNSEIPAGKEKGCINTLFVKALTEHVPFTCSYAYELFIYPVRCWAQWVVGG